MKKASFRERFRYNFENTMSSGPAAVMKWLAVASFILVVVGGLIIKIFNIKMVGTDTDQPIGFWEGAWQSLMSTIDTGNVGNDPPTAWPFRFVRIFATIGGLFITSILIAVMSSYIIESIAQLKKGRSKVLETGHTLILGWSENIFTILHEIIEANSNHKDQRIVILADRNKEKMDDEIRSKINDFKTTKVITRSGSPLELSDIPVVNPNEARSIIVLATADKNSDIYVIKSVLALTNGKNRKAGKYHIVAEIKDSNNLEAAELVGNNETVFVHTSDFIARVVAQTCRQSGLSIIYTELLQFEGDEIYFQEEKELVGKTFYETLSAYDNSSVIGICKQPENILINPPLDTIIGDGDQLIVISNDDDTIHTSDKKNPGYNDQAFSQDQSTVIHTERILVLGWNSRGIKIIEELDHYVGKDSTVTVLANSPAAEHDIATIRPSLKNQSVDYVHGNIIDRKALLNINPGSYNHIIILSYTDMPVQESDAKTLICLLQLRSISENAGKDFNIVSEMLDIRNRELAVVAKADDFIVSDNLSSLILSQVSENKLLKKVYDNLFSAEGSEIYLKRVTRYVKPGIEMDFYTVLESAARQNEIAIGYRLAAQKSDPDHNYGVKLNPVKSERIQFSEEDLVIVLAVN